MTQGDAPPKTTYFFDACISYKLVQVLNLLQKEDILLHMKNEEGFNIDAPDLVWIPEVAKRGYILVTGDNAQRRRIEEKILREQVKISTVFFPDGFSKLQFLMMARWVVNYWEGIAKDTRHCKTGETYLVKMNGKVEKFVPKK